MSQLEYLFTPIKIGPLVLKNRIIQAPMNTHLANPDGSVSERLLAHYEERARGGAGLQIVEFSYIDQQASKSSYRQLGVYDDLLLAGLSELADTIKAHGSAAGVQICHAGGQRAIKSPQVLAPSSIASEKTGIIPKELTEDEIAEIIEAFGEAAARVKRSGFDLVEIHGGREYLIAEFLCALTNKRRDKYGCSLENRMRFALEVAKKVREKVGPDFPVGFRMAAATTNRGETTFEEIKRIAWELEKVGINLLHITGAGNRLVVPMYIPRGCNVHLAQGIKEVVNIPVVASGAINDPELADEIIRENKADMVSMARPLLADAHLPQKARQGKLKDIRKCIRCNDCVTGISQGKLIKCTVNFINLP